MKSDHIKIEARPLSIAGSDEVSVRFDLTRNGEVLSNEVIYPMNHFYSMYDRLMEDMVRQMRRMLIKETE